MVTTMDTWLGPRHWGFAVWWRKVTAPLAASALLIFLFSGTRPLMDTSEARYAETAREMAFEGHWLIPHLGGHPHLTKPPLTYWLVGASCRLFGQSEWAARLPIGLAAVATTLLTALVARSMFGGKAGILAAWLQGLALVPLAAANVVTTDTLLTMFELGFMWCGWQLLLAHKQERSLTAWQIGFWAFLGGAFMTKGPAGMVPLVALGLFAIAAWREVRFRPLCSLWGMLLFLAVVLPWPLAVLYRVPNAVSIWREEVITNVFEDINHDFPRWAFPLLLVFGSFPAVLGLLFVTFVPRKEALVAQVRLAQLYLFFWVIVSLVILVAQKTRLPLYVLPLYPPLSVLGAHGFQLWRSRHRPSWERAARWAPVLVAAYAALFLSGKWYYSTTTDRRDAHRSFKGVAELIRKHLGAADAKPIVYTAEGRLGYGLMYYLQSSDLVRVGKKTPTGETLWPRTFGDVLESTAPQTRPEFLLVERKKESRYVDMFFKNADRVGTTPAYAVWKKR
ncbi:MAG: ArnT family glycosyltransferase [Candidatus Sumerlaeaceae bacterium]